MLLKLFSSKRLAPLPTPTPVSRTPFPIKAQTASGISPVRPVPPRFKTTKCERRPRSEGIPPVKPMLLDKTSSCKSARRLISFGMAPCREFPDRSSLTSALNCPIAIGIVPSNAFRPRSRNSSCESRPRSEGMYDYRVDTRRLHNPCSVPVATTRRASTTIVAGVSASDDCCCCSILCIVDIDARIAIAAASCRSLRFSSSGVGRLVLEKI
jgi:hypothetical protein